MSLPRRKKLLNHQCRPSPFLTWLLEQNVYQSKTPFSKEACKLIALLLEPQFANIYQIFALKT